MNNPGDDSPKPEGKPFLSWSILGAFIFFLVLWALGFPDPWMDDLFYNGAALNMARGGDFSNPLLIREVFPSHYFFVYPPIHPYAVYVWLSLFGISTASMLAFQNLMYFIIAATMIIILGREGAPRILSWLVPWGVAAVFLKIGLRPESLAVAMTMSGYTLLLYCRKAGFGMWLSFFLIFTGTTAAPRTSLFGAAFVLLAVWRWLQNPQANASGRLRFPLVLGSALAAAALLFLSLIHFRPIEFYHTFHMHTARINASTIDLLVRELRQFGMRWFAIFFLAVAVLYLAFRRRTGDAGQVCYFLAVTFLLAGIAGFLGPGTTWYLIFIIFLLTAALSKQIPRPWTAALVVAITFVMIGANGSQLTREFGVLTGNIDTSPPENRAAILALQSTKEQVLIVDPSVARFVFDYKLPPGALDFGCSAPFPFFPLDVELRPEDVFLLGPAKVSLFNSQYHTTYRVENWDAFGVKSRSLFKYPRQAFVVRARDCIALKAKETAAKK